VAQRKVVITKDTPGGEKADVPARVTGVIGKDLFAFDRGSNHRLRISDVVYVYRDKTLIGTLRLDMVDPEQSIGRLEEGFTKRPVLGDIIEFEKYGLGRKEIIGRVVYSDREIILDVGTKHGARPGQKYTVRRHGRRVGFLKVRDARYDTSIADPVDGTRKEDLLKGDIIELIQD
jgi:hypothetical protein